MVTSNIDCEDGLVNGATGTLGHVTLLNDQAIKIWLNFNDNDIGKRARSPFTEYMKKHNINLNFVPIAPHSVPLNVKKLTEHNIVREQFPVVPAEAITIHKSQGQTYDKICVDLTHSKKISRQLLYVAFSRVKSLQHLYIIGDFKPPKPIKDDDELQKALNKLKTEKKLQIE